MKENDSELNNQASRDEILEISRNENKNGDEREKQIYKSAIQIAYSIGIILTGIIMLVTSVLNRELPAELMIVYFGMAGTSGFYCGVKLTKRKPLFFAGGIICSMACLLFIIYWILRLCGVL